MELMDIIGLGNVCRSAQIGKMTEAVPSPCTGICRLDEKDVCEGCGRTIDEIAAWSSVGNDRRAQILHLAEQRRKSKKRA